MAGCRRGLTRLAGLMLRHVWICDVSMPLSDLQTERLREEGLLKMIGLAWAEGSRRSSLVSVVMTHG